MAAEGLTTRARDAVTVAAFKGAWWGVRALPERAAHRLFDVIADVTTRRGGPSVARMRSNYAIARPELDDAALDALVAAGVRSYLRYWCEAFRLPSLTREQIAERVTTSGELEATRSMLADGRSVVAYLGHLGNWDLAGAWSATQLAHVTTVAERLEPDALFRAFLHFREELGMTIIPLTKGENVLGQVETLVREPGAFAPLLSDRDLTSRGITVDLCGEPARLAAGPAVIARRTGAALVPITITYRRRDGGSGWGIDIRFHPAVDIAHTDDARADVQAAVQACADALGGAIREHTQDWHMMQRVFVRDLDARRG